jgi:hypothetical protein
MLNTKILDEYVRFTNGVGWAILKYRLIDYQKRLHESVGHDLRATNWNSASRTQAMIDNIDEVIKITERLGVEIKDGKFDADGALTVIENNIRQ